MRFIGTLLAVLAGVFGLGRRQPFRGAISPACHPVAFGPPRRPSRLLALRSKPVGHVVPLRRFEGRLNLTEDYLRMSTSL